MLGPKLDEDGRAGHALAAPSTARAGHAQLRADIRIETRCCITAATSEFPQGCIAFPGHSILSPLLRTSVLLLPHRLHQTPLMPEFALLRPQCVFLPVSSTQAEFLLLAPLLPCRRRPPLSPPLHRARKGSYIWL